MTGAPILTGVPRTGLRYQGFRAENKRLDESRAEKRKALQEIADMHAQEGRVLGVDEWFDIARSTVGYDAVLNGTAPTRSMLEAMRQQQNQKAEEVARQRQHAQTLRQFEIDGLIEKRVAEMARSGKSEVEIYDSLVKDWGHEAAQKYKNRLPVFVRQATVADEKDGFTIGQQFQTEQAAEDYIRQNPGMSESFYRGVRNAAKVNHQKNMQVVAQIGQSLGAGGYVADTPGVREAIRNALKPYGLDTPENEEAAIKAASGIASIRVGTDRYGIGLTFSNAWANNAPQSAHLIAAAEIKHREYVENKAKEAADLARQSVQAKSQMAIQALSALGSKNKPNPMVAQYSTIFAQFDFDAASMQEIMEAISSKDESRIEDAVRKGLRTARPAAAIEDAAARVARIEAGELYGNTPQEQYQYLSSIGDADAVRILRARGETVREMVQRGSHETLVNQQLTSAVQEIVKSVIDDRTVLERSGRFQASAEELSRLEMATIQKHVAVLAQSSGVPVENLMQYATSLLQQSPPRPISARPMWQDIMGGYFGPGFGAAGLPQPGVASPPLVPQPAPNLALPPNQLPPNHAPMGAPAQASPAPATPAVPLVPPVGIPPLPPVEPFTPPPPPNTPQRVSGFVQPAAPAGPVGVTPGGGPSSQSDRVAILVHELQLATARWVQAQQRGDAAAMTAAERDVRAIQAELSRLR